MGRRKLGFYLGAIGLRGHGAASADRFQLLLHIVTSLAPSSAPPPSPLINKTTQRDRHDGEPIARPVDVLPLRQNARQLSGGPPAPPTQPELVRCNERGFSAELSLLPPGGKVVLRIQAFQRLEFPLTRRCTDADDGAQGCC